MPVAIATDIRRRSRASWELVSTLNVFIPSPLNVALNAFSIASAMLPANSVGLVFGSALLPIAPGLIAAIRGPYSTRFLIEIKLGVAGGNGGRGGAGVTGKIPAASSPGC